MLVPILLFCLGLLLLVKGGDWFVDGASGVAYRFHIPELLIGATVVSIGTTLPEVMVSATSALSGHGEMAYGNAIGSIICNTALIAALTVAVRPAKVEREAIRLPVIFFFAAAALYAVIAYAVGYFSRWIGVALLLLFVTYMVFAVRGALRRRTEEGEVPPLDLSLDAPPHPEDPKPSLLWKDVLFLVLGAALIAVGADLLVDNGTLIAQALGVPEAVIALTFVALGTSLPELVTAITALVKGHGALSLGNVIGANLFNLVLVSGVATVLSPFGVPGGDGAINTSLLVDIPVMLSVMVLLVAPALIRGRLARWQGITLLAIYAAFCVLQFVL